MKLFGVNVKDRSVAQVFGIWLIIDALFSIAYSTDLIWQFQVGRVIRLAIGILLVAAHLPKSYAKGFGLYLALEALGSVLISPDDAILWQAGRIGRVFIGAWLYEYYK